MLTFEQFSNKKRKLNRFHPDHPDQSMMGKHWNKGWLPSGDSRRNKFNIPGLEPDAGKNMPVIKPDPRTGSKIRNIAKDKGPKLGRKVRPDPKTGKWKKQKTSRFSDKDWTPEYEA